MRAEILQKPNLDKKVSALVNTPSSLWRDISKNMLKRMRDRVRKGKDHNGSNFQKYSKATVIAKEKIGRPANVNMTDRGTMIRGLESKYTNRYADLFLGAESEIGYYHQKGMGVPKREWFGYTKDSAEKAREEYRKYLRKALKK